MTWMQTYSHEHIMRFEAETCRYVDDYRIRVNIDHEAGHGLPQARMLEWTGSFSKLQRNSVNQRALLLHRTILSVFRVLEDTSFTPAFSIALIQLTQTIHRYFTDEFMITDSRTMFPTLSIEIKAGAERDPGSRTRLYAWGGTSHL